MTQLVDLEEWEAIQQTFPFVVLYLQHTKNEVEADYGGNAPYGKLVGELHEEIQVTRVSIPQDIILLGTTKHECISKLTAVLQLFESFVDKESVETALTISSEHLPIPFPENLCARFPNLSKLVQCTLENSPREHLFHIHPKTTTISTLQHAIGTVTEINRFLVSINPTAPHSFAAPTVATSPIDADDNIRGFIENVLDKLQSLLSKCKTGASHQMMVQLSNPQDLSETKLLATLELLLSSCIKNCKNGDTVWQRASCSYPSNTSDYRGQESSSNAIKDLCSRIHRSLRLNERLRFTLLNGELNSTEHTDVDSLALQDDSSPGKSLYDLIHAGYFQRITWNSENKFTIWEKRKLALNLGFLFMYLYDCKWTKYGWKTDKMHFLGSLAPHQRENLLQDPPYLDCGPHLVPSNEDVEHIFFKGPSDFISFGKLLLELEFGEEIEATQCDKLGRPSLYLTLSFALDQARKSSNKYYTEAIRGCLDLYRNPGPSKSIMMQIYKNVVLNLNKELACLEKLPLSQALTLQVHEKAPLSKDVESYEVASTSYCSLIPNMTSTSCDVEQSKPSVADPTVFLQFETEDPALSIATESRDDKTPQMPPKEKTRTWHLFRQLKLRRSAGLRKVRMKKGALNDQDFSSIPPRTTKNRISKIQRTEPMPRKVDPCNNLDVASNDADSRIIGLEDKDAVSIFDSSIKCLDASQISSSEEFFASYKAFKMNTLQQHMSLSNESSRSNPKISVCVIDTGIDESHPAILAGKKLHKVQSCRSFMSNQGDIHDFLGHGTHIVQLILEASDNVDIYVAKISNSLEIDRRDVGRIAEAINYATFVWDVDIITMSFGFAEVDSKVEAAINEAGRRGKLLFASASNHGNNGTKTYPGKYRNVMCIHASDGKGKDGRINPAATDGADNFMTLGIAVPLFWKGAKIYRSGTSYATPIAVGFAVNILELVRRRLGQEEFLRLKNGDYLMRRIFRMMSERDNRYYFVAPWRLWDSRALEVIDGLIRNELHY